MKIKKIAEIIYYARFNREDSDVYDEIFRVSPNLFEIEKSSKFGFADNQGNVIIEPTFDCNNDGYTLVYDDDFLIVTDSTSKESLFNLKTGQELLKKIYYQIDPCSSKEHLFRVRMVEFGKFALYDAKQKKFLTGFSFNTFLDFSNGYAEISTSKKKGIIDNNGNVFFKCGNL